MALIDRCVDLTEKGQRVLDFYDSNLEFVKSFCFFENSFSDELMGEGPNYVFLTRKNGVEYIFKHILPDFDKSAEREIAVLQSVEGEELNLTHLVEVFDSRTFLKEYFVGEDLHELIGRQDLCVRGYLPSLKNTIKRLHEKGFYFFDITPNDVMCNLELGLAKLIDLDTAKRIGDVSINGDELKDIFDLERCFTRDYVLFDYRCSHSSLSDMFIKY